MSLFKTTNSVFDITDENKSFSISIPGRWRIPIYLEDRISDKLKNLLKLKSENDIELYVEEVRKRGFQIKVGDKEYNLSDFDTSKQEIPEALKKARYHKLEDMVNRMQLTYNEIMDVLDIKYFPSERTGYTLPPGIYEKSNTNKMLQGLVPDIVTVSISIDNITLKSKLKVNQTLIFTKKIIFLYNFRFQAITPMSLKRY